MKRFLGTLLLVFVTSMISFSGCGQSNVETTKASDGKETSIEAETEAMIFCSVCRYELSYEDKYCPECGYERLCSCCWFPLEGQSICAQCGKRRTFRSASGPCGNESGLSIKGKDFFRSIDTYRVEAIPLLYYEGGLAYGMEEEVPCLWRSEGEILVTTDASFLCTVYPVQEQLFCYPAQIVNVSTRGLEFNTPLLKNDSNANENYIEKYCCITEVNGYEIKSQESLDSILAEEGALRYRVGSGPIFLSSQKQGAFICGYYKSTNFYETEIKLNARLLNLGPGFTVGFEKTKEGYFIVDTSDLASGRYVIEDAASGRYYALDID